MVLVLTVPRRPLLPVRPHSSQFGRLHHTVHVRRGWTGSGSHGGKRQTSGFSQSSTPHKSICDFMNTERCMHLSCCLLLVYVVDTYILLTKGFTSSWFEGMAWVIVLHTGCRSHCACTCSFLHAGQASLLQRVCPHTVATASVVPASSVIEGTPPMQRAIQGRNEVDRS